MALSLRCPVRYVEASDLTKGIAAVAIRPETDVHVTQLPAESGGKGDALKVIVLGQGG
jgi:hypothetical protein